MARKEETTSNGRRSTPELMRSIAADSAALVKKEIQLAKQEMMEAFAARAKAMAALGAAAIMALFGVVYLGAAAARALEGVVRPWAAWLIVGGGFLALAVVAAAAGMLRAKRPPLRPDKTVETVKEDVEWAKAQLKR